MKSYEHLKDKLVEIKLAGNTIKGKLYDVGTDFIVIYTNMEFFYLLDEHIQEVRICQWNEEEQINTPPQSPFFDNTKVISTKEIFMNARGKMLQVMVFGGIGIHGYILHIFDDYIHFQSIVLGDLYIPTKHIKGLVIASSSSPSTPLPEMKKLPKLKSAEAEHVKFIDRLSKSTGKVAIFNQGAPVFNVGKIVQMDENVVHITNLNGTTVYISTDHIKTIHVLD
ncbi:hypothetical protein [Paenibacillus sp. OV219]|uniref:hypothetical protein n=1 Tax=Paenibacillus sp. OV219 TaxID=1884377 RepID=UPI0008B31E3C|nr:hypothetical protein [Paenibacillus sp. OV219]SEM54546.1 hypothetical protein SAMN05518847_101116 [Paenibacillus sp. OV219]